MRTSKTALTIIAAVAFFALLFTWSCNNKNEEQATDKMVDTTADVTMDMDQDKDENSISRFRKALAGLPRGEVVAIFNGMTPEFCATLWRNRLSDAMSMDLTDEQKNILLMAVENITPEIYTPEGGEKFEAFYKDFKPKAMAAFANDTVKLLTIVTKLDKPQEISKDAAAKLKDCNCNVSDDWCAINFDCKPRSCKASTRGCGWFWLKACNGLCI